MGVKKEIKESLKLPKIRNELKTALRTHRQFGWCFDDDFQKKLGENDSNWRLAIKPKGTPPTNNDVQLIVFPMYDKIGIFHNFKKKENIPKIPWSLSSYDIKTMRDDNRFPSPNQNLKFRTILDIQSTSDALVEAGFESIPGYETSISSKKDSPHKTTVKTGAPSTKLEKKTPPKVDYRSPEEKEIFDLSDSPDPLLTEPKITDDVKRKKRSLEFSYNIKKLYNYSCAVCGVERYDYKNNPEVEAAHIYPVEFNGSDALQNGLALCKLHHWAFDGGLLSIDDKFFILVKKSICDNDNYREIYRYKEKSIRLPKEPRYAPGHKYLMEQRKLQGFE